MADLSLIDLNGTEYNLKDASARKQVIYYGVCSTAAGTAQKEVAIDGITELYAGLSLRINFVNTNSASNPTLKINDLDAKYLYLYGTSKFGTVPKTSGWYAGAVISLTYDGTGFIRDQGFNDVTEAKADSVYCFYGVCFKAKAAVYRYQILLTCPDSSLLPISKTNNNTGTTKTLTSEKFDPFGNIYYYLSTTTVSANAAFGNSTVYHTYYSVDLRYSFNIGSTLTAGKAVYIVAVPQSDGSAVLHSAPISQLLPTTDDGKIYIYLGSARNGSSIFIEPVHPVYYYSNGEVRQWANQDAYTKSEIDSKIGDVETLLAAL